MLIKVFAHRSAFLWMSSADESRSRPPIAERIAFSRFLSQQVKPAQDLPFGTTIVLKNETIASFVFLFGFERG